MEAAMRKQGYHYLESGMRNVWLQNGFEIKQTPYGEGVSIVDVEGLHRAIGSALAGKPKLSGPEFRFLRKELGFSQRMLGDLIGSSDQSVSLWERRGRVPDSAARLIQMLYQDKMNGPVKVQRALERLRAIDDAKQAEILMARSSRGTWKEAA